MNDLFRIRMVTGIRVADGLRRDMGSEATRES